MKTYNYLLGKLRLRQNPPLAPNDEKAASHQLLISLSLLAALNVQGAAPIITKIYDAPGQVFGGLAGDGSNLYFSTLAKNVTGALSWVVSIDANGGERWKWNNGMSESAGNMRMTPTISPDGTRLFVGADRGKVYCLNTGMTGDNNYPVGMIWEYPPMGTSLSQPVRSEIAYDPTLPAIYFQCNDGNVYSLNATTGALRWPPFNTGNLNGPPPSFPDHPVPWSSAPVLDLNGTVYVGSANGYLYCLDAANGSQKWRVKLNASGLTGTVGEPVEATPTIGENGWVYCATRLVMNLGGETAVSHAYGIDPNRVTANPDNATEKIIWSSTPLGVLEPGTLGGLVTDICGTVFVGDFHGDNIFGLDGRTGEIVSNTGFGGKICQAPGLSSNGMLYVGTSSPGGGSGGGSVNGAKVSPSGTFVADWTESQWRAGPGAPGDFGSFFGGVLVRADGSGTVYIADAQFVNDTGAVYKFTSGSPSMAGDWPTLGCGNRRQHKLRTYPYTLLELGAYPFGDAALAVVNSVDSLGRVVGYSHGQACGLAVNFYVAYWTSATPMIIGNCSTLSPYPVALAANLAGQVVGETFNGPIVWPSGFAGGSPQNLPLPPGLTGGEARDINASSNIIGSPTAAAILRLSSGRPMAHRGPRRKKKRGRKGVGPKH